MSGVSQLQHTTPYSSYHERNSGTAQRSPWKGRMTLFSRPSKNQYGVQMPCRERLCSSSICDFLASLLWSLWGLQSIWLPPGLIRDLLSVLIRCRVLPRLSTWLPFSQEGTWPFTLLKRIIGLEQWEEQRREGEKRGKKKSHMYQAWIIWQVECWVVSQMFLFTVTLTHCGNSIPILQREYMTSQGSQANKMQIRNVFPALLITIASAYRTLHKITALEVFVG